MRRHPLLALCALLVSACAQSAAGRLEQTRDLALAGHYRTALLDARCAAQEYRELVKRYPMAPESFEARERLGDLDMRLGDVRGALEAWRDQVAAAPDHAGADAAQLKISRALADRGEYFAARGA